MRMVLATVLTFEALVVALAIAVAVPVYGVSGATAGLVGGGLAVACLLTAGVLRRPFGLALGSLLQVAVLATAFIVPIMVVLGGLFTVLWISAIVLGRRVEAFQAGVRAERARLTSA